MGWSKRDVIKQAYSELGIADYEFDLNPEDIQTALRQLDAMVASWSVNGALIGFSGGDGFGSVDADTEVPVWAYSALYLNLALCMAGGLGKSVAPTTMSNASKAMTTLWAAIGTAPQRQITGYGGSGRRWWPQQLPTRRDDITVNGTDLELNT